MPRRPLDLLAAGSLLLCAAAALSWAASYRGARQPFDEFPDGGFAVKHWRGAVCLVVPCGREDVSGPQLIPFPPKRLAAGESSSWVMGGAATIRGTDGGVTRLGQVWLDESPDSRWFRTTRMDHRTAGGRVAGIEWRAGRRSVGPVDTHATPAATFQRWAAVVVPHPYWVGLTAILPAWRIARAVRGRRRARVGLCPRCGYDLRATPHQCPECGTAASPA